MGDSELITRTLHADDFDQYFDVFIAAFMQDAYEAIREPFREVFEPERTHGVFDGDELIGCAAMFHPSMTLPGGTGSEVAAITAVGVKPGNRRRGVLTRLMRAQLHGLHDSGGPPVATLYASEGAIYRRFGYEVVSQEMKLSLPRGAAFLPSVELDPRRVRELGKQDAIPHMRELYPQAAAARAGWLSRDEAAWRTRIASDEADPTSKSRLRFAVHPDGYAIYRPLPNWTERGPAFELQVLEVVARTTPAYASLWRYLLDLDLVGEVRWAKAAPDETVTDMIADPRAAVRQVKDGLWMRLIDVDRALRERRYSAPLDLVLEITDSFCPWNAGRWHVATEPGGACSVERSGGAPHLTLDVTDLAAVFLGGTTLEALARAGRTTEQAAGALERTSRAFATGLAPHCPESF